MEDLDTRAQRIQDRLRASGDKEAAELIDELYGLAWPGGDGDPRAKKRWQDDPLQYIWLGDKKVRKTGDMVASMARAKAHQ
jgi:hypothetical protein